MMPKEIDKSSESKIETLNETKEEATESSNNEDSNTPLEEETIPEPKTSLERMKYEMRDMTGFQKFKYILYYNIVYIIILCVVIAVSIYCIHTMRQNSRPVGISYVILNCNNNTSALTVATEGNPFKDYLEAYGLNSSKYQNHSNTRVMVDLETQEDDYYKDILSSGFLTQFREFMNTDFYDVVITDKKGLEYLIKSETKVRLKIMDDVLSDELMNNKIIKDHTIREKDLTDIEYAVALDIRDTDFAKKLKLPYDDIYLCYAGTSEENKKNAEQLTRYIFGLN
ncbi:MAG: hypothetical protein IKQ71_03270 [Lachnospiraceae bacterium]|nr:hypothetical protein [Lachnospiraceae bacterium]